MIKKPWVEANRPASLDEVIFTNATMKKAFERFIVEGNIPNLLLYGGPGTGKTSISKALCRDLDVDIMDRLRINCSDEKIDALREKVRDFALTMPISSMKVVQLEEFDHLSLDGQALLRSLIEEASSTCRFIATCNYINKVIPALRSRFQEFELKAPDRDEVLVRGAEILAKYDIEFELEDLEKVVAVGYPDMRKIIQLLEQFSGSGKLVVGSAEGTADWKLGLLEHLEKGDLKAARKLVCAKASKEELQDVYRYLYDNIHRVKGFDKKWDQAVVLIADYMYKHAFACDAELNVSALFIELGAL